LIQQGIQAYVTDAISVDLMDKPGFENHKTLLGAGIPLVEGVNNLRSVGRERFFFLALPLLLVGLEAAPARAVALLDLEGTNPAMDGRVNL
jgi:arylformamidase